MYAKTQHTIAKRLYAMAAALLEHEQDINDKSLNQ
jgi:hypothetical protein